MSNGVMSKLRDNDLEVREFETQSRSFIYFQTNTVRKAMCPLILPAMG